MPCGTCYSLAEGDVFVPHAPKTTAEASQMGWYKSQSGSYYTVFWWPDQNVFTVHDENLEPATSEVFATKPEAVSYIQTEQDKGVKVPLPERDPTWLFSKSLDGYGGVDTWGGDRVKLAHSGDWVRLKGVTDYGGQFTVTYVFESGDASMMPQDFKFVLKPGERRTIQNFQGGGIDYNVEVIWDGPLYTYKGQQQEESALEEQQPAPEVAPMLNGPFMQRIRAFMAARRGGG